MQVGRNGRRSGVAATLFFSSVVIVLAYQVLLEPNFTQPIPSSLSQGSITDLEEIRTLARVQFCAWLRLGGAC